MPALIQKDAGFVRLPRDRLLPSLPARYSPGGRYRRALLSATLDSSGCNTVGITLAFTLKFPFFFYGILAICEEILLRHSPPLAVERHLGEGLLTRIALLRKLDFVWTT